MTKVKIKKINIPAQSNFITNNFPYATLNKDTLLKETQC